MGFNLDDYETVDERLHKFWKEYPDGRIETEVIEATDRRFIIMARVFRTEADQRYWVSGLACEYITERGVNSTHALSNGETSAIGRALANGGFSAKGKRPSREEMESVERNSNNFEKKLQEKVIKVEKPSDPWTIEPKPMPVDLDDALQQLNQGIKPQEIPHCKHGARKEMQGVGKTNRPYYGMVCTQPKNEGQCDAIWYQLDKSGKWIPPKPAVETQELN